MGLFGALFAGVSGLSSQSNKISIISNNISNVNTVGYKEVSAAFNTLVVPSGTTSFSPGGVISQNQQLVGKQGLIQGTSSSTDLAISGNGFFAVNSSATTGAGQLLYSRSGSFTQDASGNFVNANGLYLQGWVLDSNGNKVNTTNVTDPASLTTVKIQSNASGVATPTSAVSIAANLNASQTVLLGAGETLGFNPNNTNNYQNTASNIIVGNDFGAAAGSKIARGDAFTVTTGGTTASTFTYGGFAVGRKVNDATSANIGDSTLVLRSFLTQTTPYSVPIIANGANGTITVTSPSAHGYTTGDVVNIENVSASIGGLPASLFNGYHTIVKTGANTFTFSVTNNTGAASTAATGGTGSSYANRSYPFNGNVLDAKTATDAFLGTSTVAPFDPNALTFQVIGSIIGTQTFKYTTGSPDTTQGQFNSLNTLVATINQTSSLNARIVDGRLYISATDANEGLTFVNGKTGSLADATGSYGLDWVNELGLSNVTAANTGVNRFNTFTNLSKEINTTANITSSINKPLGASSLNINASDPQTTINFADVASPANTGSLLQELGFVTTSGASITSGTPSGANGYDTGTFGVKYDSNNSNKNMSGGNIAPQFTRNTTIYDALGISHTIAFNVSKISTNIWAAELTVVPATDLGTGARTDGQIAAGTITFNGDGSLSSVSSGLTSNIVVSWADQSSNSTMQIALGDINKTNGLSQFSAPSNATSVTQNGSSAGQLTGISIDSNGYVISSFSNGQTQKTFKIPLIQINNPNGMEAVSGDAFKQTQGSGNAIAADAGTNGTGSIQSSSLEQSTVDLSSQLTNLIVAQQAYGANSKLLTVADRLLQQLDQIIQ